MQQDTSGSSVIVAMDFSSRLEAEAFADSVTPELCRLKVGKELFTVAGPQFVRRLVNRGFDVFLDLKFHDIPNTVAQAVAAAADLGVWMTDLHASGGSRMMEMSKKVLEDCNSEMLLIAVTVLTSMDQQDLTDLGIPLTPAQQVMQLATLANASGMDGVVSSALEARQLRSAFGEDFVLVTPGIRPVGTGGGDDQRRIVTPTQAIKNGSSYLVIGRPITQAKSPTEVLLQINRDIASI